MAAWNSFSYICTRALHSFRSFAHCRAASTVIPPLPKSTFTPSIQPNLGLPRTRPPLTSAIDTLLAIRYSSILWWVKIIIIIIIVHVERMDEYRMARRVLMAEISGDGYEEGRGYARWMVWKWPYATEEWLWTLRGNAQKIGKSGEPSYICNWTRFTRPFLLGTVFFRTALPCSGGYHMERGWMRLGKSVKRAQLLKIKAKGCILMTMCVFYLTWHDCSSLV